MTMQPNTPADKRRKPSHRTRLVATSLGVSALLAVGGVAWASGLNHTAGNAQEAQPDSTAGASAQPGTPSPDPASPNAAQTGSGTPDPGASSATLDPAATGARSAAKPSGLPEVNPAPVDRKGKSDQELAAIAQPTAAPVELTAKKAVKGGVSATITDMTAVQGVATGIGEVAGPAVRFKVSVVNTTAAPLGLDRALVDVSYGKDDAPASQLSGPDPVAFPASVAPGATGVGVFIFAVPLDARDTVKIHFNLEAETPIATFAGRAPAGNKP
ncbi:hypothetical protein SAMN05660473_01615 [Arthrobacter sp. 49Tsu3.1M3]|jgi:hypothetical protein|uniref:hypothetical protein n=1 Tax=Arthrobacter sp. 49Tsu3.1M3 TaxID=1279029 RepID=UPI0009A74F73|nr:hypothetical protein [Arthrobacter sp. 49Tsu3.1M3]SKB61863.1 hypothetical protein SAMN05660473_01615 [Arthrobacter sp. 49Tsu3.1M3]